MDRETSTLKAEEGINAINSTLIEVYDIVLYIILFLGLHVVGVCFSLNIFVCCSVAHNI